MLRKAVARLRPHLGWLTAWALASMLTTLAQSPVLRPNHATYHAGEDIALSFANGPGNRLDWIGIYPEGIEPGPTPSTLWFYVDNTRQGNTGLREGTVTFAGGLSASGPWTAYLLENDGYTILAQTAFTVVDPIWPLVRPDKPVYTTGESIAVTFTNGPGNRLDWIGIYKEGQTPGAGPTSTLWSYGDGTQTGTTGLTDGTVTFAGGLTNSGNYVVFFLQDDGYEVLASEPFTVNAPAPTIPRIVSVAPPSEAANQAPNATYVATIRNGTTAVNPATVVLELNGAAVVHQYAVQADLVTITHTPTDLYASGSTNTFRLRFSDTASPANAVGSETRFSVAAYRNLVLPAPLYFENFDNAPEGGLPTGWTGLSYTDVQNPELDLGNLDSASYAGWTVVAADRFTRSFVTYSDPDNPDDWETDYQRVLAVNPLNVVNGRVYDAPLATGRFVFGNSGYRNGLSQVVYLFSPDFNLTGKTNVHLSFHSLWEQNQDSIAAIEYSVDRGQNWLPVAYFLDRPDVLTVTNEVTGMVTVDAEATFTAESGDVARYVDPDTFEEKGGTYGAFIGAPISPALAPFIEARSDDDPVGSKRIELYRVAGADNQAAVRFRFAHAGTDSWYFGVDDFGLYSLAETPSEPPLLTIARSGASVLISWPATASGFVLESAATVGPGAAWAIVPGVVGNSVTVTPADSERLYRLRQ